MAEVLICASGELEPQLTGTLLWRQQFERQFATTFDQARRATTSSRPAIVLVDRDMSWAPDIVKAIRQHAGTRRCSIAVIARGDFQPVELELLEAGANAVLRLPPDEDWDKRLARLLQVTARRETRVPIHVQLEASLGASEKPFTASTINVSETGMLIESPVPLGLGQELDFALQVPGKPGLIAGRARVVRLASRYEYGLEFSDLDGAVFERLHEFLQSSPGA